MAKVSRSHVREAGEVISLTEHQSTAARKEPVRVKLERINADVSRSLPPDDDRPAWIERLKAALGTASIEVIDATLYQLQAAARLPNSGGVCAIAVNAALAMIESEQPKGETECAIVLQMATIHSATMAVLGRLNSAYGHRNVLAAATAVSRLSRAFAILVETLRRLRNGGSQYVRVEHVHIESNAQAVIGNFQREASKKGV
jgi:hypothetical protein